jgi:alcohol dehydrogenase class IV/protocatechuate 3,4-dioxygenase beta subunit
MREYTAHPARIIFGAGALTQLPDEIRRLGGTRALVVGGHRVPIDVLGPLLAAQVPEVAMHTPVEVTERALSVLHAASADCLVSIGGGSATGLGKALAHRTGLPLVAVPTTYAGSEVTPVLGESSGGQKTTLSSTAVLPRTVVYDVALTLGLPPAVSVTSGVNAMAHAVEALYAPQANAATSSMAVSSLRLMTSALPRIVANPSNVDARADALTAAWLAGTCMGTVGMGLHHKLCHVLGGSFGLPHAETHTVVLPHVVAYNAAFVDAVDAPGLYDFIASLGGPLSLAALGFRESDVDAAVSLATASTYPNPRPVTAEGVAGLLRDALAGRRPAGSASSGPASSGPASFGSASSGSTPSGSASSGSASSGSASSGSASFGWLTDEVSASFAAAPARLRELLSSLVRHLHGFAVEHDVTQEEWTRAIEFLTATGQISSAKRQEFVLLSDVLGVSSMVDLLTNSRVADATPSAVLGPFYVDNPPALPLGSDISGGFAGRPLWTDVRVSDVDGSPIAGATVDVWQSNEDGFYDVQLGDHVALRARFTSDADGAVQFWSILPSEYPIPADGPVGALLAAAGRHPYRAPHLHFLITADGYRQLITQLFVAGGAYLDSDTVFGVKKALVVDFAPGVGAPPPGRPVDGEWRQLTYTFRLAPS